MPEAAEVIPPDCLLTFRYNEPKYSVSSFLFPIIFPIIYGLVLFTSPQYENILIFVTLLIPY